MNIKSTPLPLRPRRAVFGFFVLLILSNNLTQGSVVKIVFYNLATLGMGEATMSKRLGIRIKGKKGKRDLQLWGAKSMSY